MLKIVMQAWLAAMVALPLSAWCAEDTKIITMERGYYYYDGEPLNRSDLYAFLISDPRTEADAIAGERLYNPALGVAALGGMLLAWPVGNVAAGGDADWRFAVAGVAVGGVGIYLAKRSAAHYRKAIDVFNRRDTVSNSEGVELFVGPQQVRVAWRF
ncbi:MAG: hypothetical protein OEW08_01570 [Gammaproteobacteria bacterium]|nr:hypothetical protein [Gammaproteobacteria bacterium]